MMLQPRRLGQKVFVSSLDIYDLFEKDRSKYYMWLQRNVIRNMSLTVPNDYLIYRKFRRGIDGHPIDLYLSLTVAKFLCIKESTRVSKRVRTYIEDEIETKN